MNEFKLRAKHFSNAEEMADAYLKAYYGDNEIEFPISPFRLLKDEKVLLLIQNYGKLEGVYVPPENEDDVAMVGINLNRPITRQRFTAAHELCHHFRDADRKICPIYGKKNASEKFADEFASALLMPLDVLRCKVTEYKDVDGNVSFEAAMQIADFFGVSFESCVFRIAYKLHAISGDTDSNELKKRIRRFKPDKVRKNNGLTYVDLYSNLIDNYTEQLSFMPTDYARYVFENDYIYNDSRMEGLDVSIEQASEIVADLRLNMQNSEYCTEDNELFMSIAGHYKMYKYIFEEPVKDSLSVYDSFHLNKDLFAYYPYPDYGGKIRDSNTLVLKAKFETVDYHDIFSELTKVDEEVRDCFDKRFDISTSEYIKYIARIHHKIAVIHPFSDGNGRTSRAFMNVQLVRAGLSPLYIKVEEKEEYVKALGKADTTGCYDDLYEIIFKVLIRSQVELSRNS